MRAVWAASIFTGIVVASTIEHNIVAFVFGIAAFGIIPLIKD